MKCYALLLVLLLFSFHALSQAESGGDRVGNGGDNVVCYKPNGAEKNFILEEYEAKVFFREELHIGEDNLSYIQKVNLLLERFKTAYPERYKAYKSKFAYFVKNVNFQTTALRNVDDAWEMPVSNCRLQQAAYFVLNSNGRLEYFLNSGIWMKLNENQKALLVMHELIYTEAYFLGQRSSVFVRSANIALTYFNGKNAQKFDHHLMQGLSVYLNGDKIVKALQHSYSEAIALFFLGLDLHPYYQNPEFRMALDSLKNRFSDNSLVLAKVNEHQFRMN